MPPATHLRSILIAIVAVATTAGCGQAAGSGPAGHPSSMTHVTLATFHDPAIRGGSPAERRLLAQIVRRTRPTQIRALKVILATKNWRPLRPGDVELIASTTPVGHGLDNMLGEWEAWLVGGAFRDRSASLGLPRVIAVADGAGEQRADGLHPPPAPQRGLATFHRQAEALASRSGARVLSLRTGVPDGYSAAVTLQIASPVWSLRHRLPELQSQLDRLGSDGIFLSLYEADGRALYVAGNSQRFESGEGQVRDARYASCVQVGLSGGPFTLAPPLPCPSTWRPPPTTPSKRPALHGWESGGRAERGSDRGGTRILYLPGTTLGQGFTLENPNGHPVTVESIAPAVAAEAPIRYTGARIQVPPSRATRWAQLQTPYAPEPPFRPFTIKPGDWVNVGLHYAIARCTPATAGRTITENRRLAITYVLKGETHTVTYANTPYVISLPRACLG
jgi:hypothetical protein